MKPHPLHRGKLNSHVSISMKKKLIIVLYLAIVLLMIAPILSIMTASMISNACGASLDEGSPHTCFILGHDIGPLLYNMGMAGWFLYITLPTGLVLILAFSVILLTIRFYRKVS